MDFAIHKTVFQSEKHWLFSNGELVSVDTVPTNVLCYGTPEFEEVAKLYLLNTPSFPSPNYIKAFQTVVEMTPMERIPWSFCLPGEAYRRLQRGVVSSVRDSLSDVDLGYYQTIYKRSGKVLDYLQPAKIDTDQWEKLSSDPVVATFKPNNDGFAERVTYSRTSTVTGRLKVVGGPNILLLRKNARCLLKSRFGSEGAIYALDYKSLEPRLLLSIGKGTVADRDIYQTIKDELFSNQPVSRDDVKQVVLSEIYGAGFETILRELPHVENLPTVIRLVEDYFGIQQLKTKLSQEAETTGRRYLTNCYGRRVSITEASPYMFPNRVVQSAAVDVALHGFTSMIDYLIELDRLDTIVPLFVVHDALVCDVHSNAVHVLPTLCKLGSTDIPRFSNPFYVQHGKF